jgi:polyisoprenoid-binding protein YceI
VRRAAWALALLAACTPAEAGVRADEPGRPARAAPGEAARLDVERSVIRWRGTKFRGLGSHSGVVRLASGEVALRDGRVSAGSFTVDMRTIEVTDIPASDPVPRRRLREHLMHDDFFAVARFPEARFVVTGAAPAPGDSTRITGNLTLRGRTRGIAFPARVAPHPDGTVRARARLRIDRQLWGVAYRGSRVTNDLVDDVIQLDLDLVTLPR